MITDKTAACACCTAALVSLKNIFPSSIAVSDISGNKTTETVTYEEKSGVVYCSCRNYFAYAKANESDFSLLCDGITLESVAENNELIKMIFISSAKVCKNITGAVLYLNSYDGNVF